MHNYVCICPLCCKSIICMSVFSTQAKMRKNKGKTNTIEKEFVFEFKAGKHHCVLKVPLQFPLKENVSDLHGRIMLLHKIPCFVENGNVLIFIWACIRFNPQFINILFPSCKFELLCTPSNISALILDLKNRLVSFIERETLADYDREAEAALQRLNTGEVDVNKLTNLWAKAYSEVRAQSQSNN